MIGVGAAIQLHRLNAFTAARARARTCLSLSEPLTRPLPKIAAAAYFRDELDLGRVARLQRMGGAGRNIQAHAVGRLAVENASSRFASRK